MRKKDGCLANLLENKAHVALLVVCIVGLAFLAPYKSFVMQWMIDMETLSAVVPLLLVGGGIFLSVFWLEIAARNLFARMNSDAAARLRHRMMDKLLDRKYAQYYLSSTGAYLSTLTNDLRMIQDDYYTALFNIALYGGMLLFALLFMGSIHPLLLLVALVIGTFPILLPKVFSKRLSAKRGVYSGALASYSTTAKDILQGYEVIRVFGAGGAYKRLHADKSKKIAGGECAFQQTMNANIATSSFVNNVLFFSVMALGILLVHKGYLTIGYMVTATNLTNYTLQPFAMISQCMSKIISTRPVREKIADIGDEPPAAAGREDASMHGNIALSNVSFAYPKAEGVYALSGLSMALEAGKKYAIIGQSGCGKSTIGKLLCRFYDDFDGDIWVDDVNLSSLAQAAVSRGVLMISQTPYVFNASIRDNITLLETTYSTQQIQKAIDSVGLRTYIDGLPEGIDTHIVENGKSLSGGQMQRVAIARALVREAKVLIVDEATSSLDPALATSIEAQLLDFPGTLIMITHHYRAQIMRKYDRIFLMEEGRVLAEGTYAELAHRLPT